MYYELKGEKSILLRASPSIRRRAVTFISRIDLSHQGTLCNRFLGLDESGNSENLEDAFRLSDLKLGPDDGALKTLTYSLADGNDQVGRVRLWYEPKTYQIKKRILQSPSSLGGGILTETFTEIALDVDFSDESFKLPPGKPAAQ